MISKEELYGPNLQPISSSMVARTIKQLGSLTSWARFDSIKVHQMKGNFGRTHVHVSIRIEESDTDKADRARHLVEGLTEAGYMCTEPKGRLQQFWVVKLKPTTSDSE